MSVSESFWYRKSTIYVCRCSTGSSQLKHGSVLSCAKCTMTCWRSQLICSCISVTRLERNCSATGSLLGVVLTRSTLLLVNVTHSLTHSLSHMPTNWLYCTVQHYMQPSPSLCSAEQQYMDGSIAGSVGFVPRTKHIFNIPPRRAPWGYILTSSLLSHWLTYTVSRK